MQNRLSSENTSEPSVNAYCMTEPGLLICRVYGCGGEPDVVFGIPLAEVATFLIGFPGAQNLIDQSENRMARGDNGGCLLPPDFVVIRQNRSFTKKFFFRVAAHAVSVGVLRSQGFPPVVRLLLFLSALRLFPGHTPAQELSCLEDGTGSYLRRSQPIRWPH